MKQSSFSLCLALLSLVTIGLSGEKPAELDFSSVDQLKEVKVAKGEWKIADGSLYGAELESDNHAAVGSILSNHQDSTIYFRVQVNGAKGFHLSYNHSKGHLFRVRLQDGEVSLVLDKDKKDPASKAITMDRHDFAVKPGEWIDLCCKVEGDTVTVNCGEVSLTGTHSNLTKKKTGYRFIVIGSAVLVDDIVITE